MKLPAKVALGFVAVLAVLQVVPVDRSNPPVLGEVQAPAEVKAVLKRACWDCHSNETTWPWYSRVAPMSFLVRSHVKDGRKHLNFSEWGTYAPQRKVKKQKEVGEEVEEKEMPMASYVWIHRDAALSPAEAELLRAWATGPVSD